ncbi:GAF domain-containing sensor histidine kinase [Spirulina sp. CS-785/01]|uniref:GAF domain-containing sensor histidine kinase n=1 Tax=Spirulina sp. CS-785/01 TaxID=3021716 RepID=UPI00232C51A1|nr:GAF domain-containing sensor histidine kinase [Spirulina sp. CS-785/01]MDB9314030.1 GAF domain-containing sensor histidine kinase [Spirulina sp. CS-785/01]
MSISASSELVTLCQAQVNLLVEGLGAAWCAVYLTEKWVQDLNQKLVPVVVYPENQTTPRPTNSDGVDISPVTHPSLSLPPSKLLQGTETLQSVVDSEPTDVVEPDPPEPPFWQRKQLVLPLIHQEEVLGVLATRRDDRPWQSQELSQIDQIANTLAIACFFDRENGSLQNKLGQQKQEVMGYHDRLDTLLHQVRSPMTALRTFSKLLLKRLTGQDRTTKIVQNILQQSDRASDLLKQMDICIDDLETYLTGLPQPDSPPSLNPDSDTPSPLSLLPGSKLNLEPVPLPPLLDPLIASADAIAQDKNIDFQTEIPPHLPPVQADATALREILSNLLDNAIKYTPQGGQVWLETGLTNPEASQQGIAIHDTGYGIPPEDQPRIFERYFRGVQANSDIEGTGLGLAIAHNLTQQMNGNLELISPSRTQNGAPPSPFPGTTFIVWLPLA